MKECLETAETDSRWELECWEPWETLRSVITGMPRESTTSAIPKKLIAKQPTLLAAEQRGAKSASARLSLACLSGRAMRDSLPLWGVPLLVGGGWAVALQVLPDRLLSARIGKGQKVRAGRKCSRKGTWKRSPRAKLCPSAQQCQSSTALDLRCSRISYQDGSPPCY